MTTSHNDSHMRLAAAVPRTDGRTDGLTKKYSPCDESSTDATRTGGLQRSHPSDVGSWLRRLVDPHKPCRQTVAELSSLIAADRDRQRDAAKVAAAAVSWLEQRAAGYGEDARHLRAKHPESTVADAVAKAVAAELRQAAVDVAHALGQRGE